MSTLLSASVETSEGVQGQVVEGISETHARPIDPRLRFFFLLPFQIMDHQCIPQTPPPLPNPPSLAPPPLGPLAQIMTNQYAQASPANVLLTLDLCHGDAAARSLTRSVSPLTSQSI